MKVYYAHHLWKYNTPIEEYEIYLIKKELEEATFVYGGMSKSPLIKRNTISVDIINPNGAVDQTLTEEEIMTQCLNLVRECDILVFSSINNVIGYGVWQEVNHALAYGKTVYYIDKDKLVKLDNFSYKILNKGDNRRLFATVEK